ncbi:MAG: hypothetical protein ACRDRT_03945 [Pseudonocardiaceae bacterium]
MSHRTGPPGGWSPVRHATVARVTYSILNWPPIESMASATAASASAIGRESGEAAGRGKQVQPLLAGVVQGPVDPPLLRRVELAGRLGLIGELRVHGVLYLQRSAPRLV